MNEKITLANAMKDSKLVSDRYIYEYIFNMSEEQWLQERVDVIEDLKLRFRQNQIEQEGNDPAITGVSFGTPHDLATVHMSSKEVEEKDPGGRPPEGIKPEQHKNAMGWDPTGKKELQSLTNPANQKSTFTADTRWDRAVRPVSTESHNIMKYLKNKQPKMLFESLKTQKQHDVDSDTGTMLDENNIL
jgi:hypothetical protein